MGPKETLYQPGEFCDLWEPLFPAHDYPFPCAEATLRAWVRTGQPIYREGVERWVEMIAKSLPARDGKGGCAEQYGRCIHFLDQAATLMKRPDWHALADRVESEALSMLWRETCFRTHPGEERYDAVDGLGWLLLAIMERQAGAATMPDYGLFF